MPAQHVMHHQLACSLHQSQPTDGMPCLLWSARMLLHPPPGDVHEQQVPMHLQAGGTVVDRSMLCSPSSFPHRICVCIAGYTPKFPATLSTEFKRPTMLPATLQAVLMGEAAKAAGSGKQAPLPATGAPLEAALLTGDGQKPVLTLSLMVG